MLNRYRQSWPARITALGFIVTLICGNFWVIDALLGVSAPGWVVDGMLIGMLTALVGGVGLVALAIFIRPSRHEASDDSNKDAGNIR